MNRATVVAENVRRAQAALNASGLSGFISDRPDDIAYLIPARAFVYRVMAEGRGLETVLLPARGEPLFVTARAYTGYYRSVGVAARPTEELANSVETFIRGAARPFSMPREVSGALRELVGGMSGLTGLVHDNAIETCRKVKSAGEIALIRTAAASADAGMAAAIACSQASRTELEAAGEAERVMRGAGAESFAFSTIVSSGPELGLMREVTSEREMQPGDWVMIDLGCARVGYNAEFARSFQIDPGHSRYAEAYRAVSESQAAAIGAIRPGTQVRVVDEIAREVLTRAGLDAVAYTHLTGHGIGTAVWERPFIGADSEEVFEAGMVVCVEPGVFIPGEGGIRIEDVVLVTNDGHERLTRTPTFELSA